MKVKQIIEMEYGELEGIVCKHFNTPQYEFVTIQGCGNNCSITFNVPKVEPLDRWRTATIRELKNGGHPLYSNHIIMQALVNEGALAPGEYLIKVSW